MRTSLNPRDSADRLKVTGRAMVMSAACSGEKRYNNLGRDLGGKNGGGLEGTTFFWVAVMPE